MTSVHGTEKERPEEQDVLRHQRRAAAKMNGLPRTTPSLRLRHFVQDDAATIRALNAEASTRRWLPSHVYPTLEDASSAVAYLIACYAAPGDPLQGPYVLAVEQLQTGRLLGHVGFSPLDNEVEVSYAIAEAFRGRGYGLEALVHASHWLTQAFGVARVLALTASANLDSRRLLERASFVHVQEELRRFQGCEQWVRRYCWPAFAGRDTAHPQGR